MDFKKFTFDAKLAIVQLETFGMGCLTPCIDQREKFIATDNNIRIWAEPLDWNTTGGLAELYAPTPYDIRWSFQLNRICLQNQIFSEDIIVGFIMLPKRYMNTIIPDSEINADVHVGSACISTFQFEPFKFVPMIHDTYFIRISAPYHKPIIRFNQPVNYDIYYLTTFLQSDERRWCGQIANRLQLSIPITNKYVITYRAGMCEIQTWQMAGLDANTDVSVYDFTTNIPTLPKPKLPFDKDEFIQKTTHHLNRVND